VREPRHSGSKERALAPETGVGIAGVWLVGRVRRSYVALRDSGSIANDRLCQPGCDSASGSCFSLGAGVVFFRMAGVASRPRSPDPRLLQKRRFRMALTCPRVFSRPLLPIAIQRQVFGLVSGRTRPVWSSPLRALRGSPRFRSFLEAPDSPSPLTHRYASKRASYGPGSRAYLAFRFGTARPVPRDSGAGSGSAVCGDRHDDADIARWRGRGRVDR